MTHGLADDVHDDGAVNAVSISRLLPEEFWCIVLRLHADESVVAAQTPAARVPLYATTEVAGEKGLGPIDAEACLLEEAQAADAARHIRYDGALSWHGEHDVPAIVQEVWRLDVRRERAELQILRNADRAGDLALDTDVSIDVDRERAAQVVVPEARLLCVRVCREKESAARNDRNLDQPRSRSRLLRVG